jgi:hypothetical protein
MVSFDIFKGSSGIVQCYDTSLICLAITKKTQKIARVRVSMATGFCPVMANRTAQPWPLELPSGGQ